MGKPKNNKKTSKAEEASDEEIVDIKPKKTTKQPAKAAPSSSKASFSALAALEDDDNKLPSDNEDTEESNNVEPEEPEPVADVKPKKGAKNNKKQKASKAAESDDEGQEPAADIKPKKNNNKKSKGAENDDEEPAAEPAKPEPAKAKGKKGKKNATDYLASLSLEEEAPAEPQEEKKPEPKPAEKGKKGKKGKSQEDYLATLDEPAEEQEEKKPEPPKPAPAAKGGKKGKKGQSQDDYLSSLAEEPAEEAEAKPEPPKPAPAAKGKKGKKGQSQDDYLASLDEESSEAPKQEEPKKPEAKKAEPKKKPEAKKKEEPKKQDKKAPAKAPAKPLNPKLAALKALQEQKKKEEEELQRIEEEKRRQEEELIRKMQEEAEKEKQRQTQLKIEEKRKIKELKKKGIFKTKKQIEAEERAKRMVELMIQQGGVAALDKQKAQAENEEEEEAEEAEAEQPKTQKQEKPKAAPVAEQPKQEEKKEKSWEELLSDDEEAPAKEKSWEEMLSDDEEQPTQKAPATATPAEKTAKQVVETPAAKAETKEEGDTEKTASQKKDLRSPICCVLGHVDTGKTKLLDKIRNTNVQLGEAGGITQQIGATYVPMEAVKTQTSKLGEKIKLDFQVPGLLIIDTPGHESFTNLRSRGANLCDIAILVVDIMHGLERQTIESINLLKQKKVPFVVALNKVDQIYDWQNHPNTPIRDSLKKQPKHTIVQFEDLVRRTQGYFQEQGLNAELYYKNKEVKKVVSLVPTSAITGEGMADLLAVVTQLTQMFMAEKIAYKDEFQCTILEVKVVEGHGTTIDVILVNGVIHEGDRIVVCTLNGPVVTTIRALLTPKPLREMRVKGEYLQHKQIKAAMGIKIAAQDLDGAVPGSSLLILKEGDDVEEMKEEVMKDLNQLLRKVSKSDKGVYVQSSTLGSLEALLEFLHTSKIPVCGINIGPVHKADVVRSSTMLEHAPEYAVILAFDVVVTKDAQEYAEKCGLLIFTANIIYHLFDKFTAHMKKIQDEKKQAALAEAVWPCVIRVIPGNVFHNKDPITIGVDIVEGKLKLQTPLIVPTKQGLELGRVVGIQHNKQPVNEAEKGKSVAIQIDSGKTTTFGRHFDHTDLLYSKLTRSSLDKLKEVYRDELKTDDLKLIVKIKKVLGVQ